MAYAFRRGPRAMIGWSQIIPRPRTVRIFRIVRQTRMTLPAWNAGAILDAPVGLRRVEVAG